MSNPTESWPSDGELVRSVLYGREFSQSPQISAGESLSSATIVTGEGSASRARIIDIQHWQRRQSSTTTNTDYGPENQHYDDLNLNTSNQDVDLDDSLQVEEPWLRRLSSSRNSGNPSQRAPSRSPGAQPQQGQPIQQQQQQPNQSQSNQGQPQQQLSGQSFESDFDLLVYLGETETETDDIVETERSLDYLDNTWRQSICDGYSLAGATLDGSLGDITSTGVVSPQPFDLLTTPTPASGSQVVLPSQNPWFGSRPAGPVSGSGHLSPAAVANKQTLRPDRSGLQEDRQLSRTLDRPRTEHLTPRLPGSSVSSENLSGLRSDRIQQQEKSNLSQVKPQQQQEQEQEQPKKQNINSRMTPANQSAAELDQLLAEMNQSLDLESLARFDTRPSAARWRETGKRDGQPEPRVPPRPVSKPPQPPSGSSRQNSDKNNLLRSHQADQDKYQRPATRGSLDRKSKGSILDEFDGASKLLEQMLNESTSTRKRIAGMNIGTSKNTKLEVANQPEQPQQVQQQHQQQVSNKQVPDLKKEPAMRMLEVKIQNPPISPSSSEDELEPEVAEITASIARESAASPSSSSVADTTAKPSVVTQRKRFTLDRARFRSNSSPPTPPEVDYDIGVGLAEGDSTIRVVEAEPHAPPSHTETQVGRMRRLTMNRMRSMRHKISDLSRTTGEQVRRSRSVKRRSPPKLEQPDITQPDESGSRNFGEKLRQRLSTSKNRLSKLLASTRKRAQSTSKTTSILADQLSNSPVSDSSQKHQTGAKLSSSSSSSSMNSSLSGLERSKRSKKGRKSPGRLSRRSIVSSASVRAGDISGIIPKRSATLSTKTIQIDSDLDQLRMRSRRTGSSPELELIRLADQTNPTGLVGPTRSQSVKSMADRTAFVSRRLLTPTNSFRPMSVSGAANYDGANIKPEASETEPHIDTIERVTVVTPVQPLSATEATLVKAPSPRAKSSPSNKLRAATMFDGIRNRCAQFLAGGNAGKQHSVTPPRPPLPGTPAKPPRRRKRAKSEANCDEIRATESSSTGTANRMTQLARSLKNSAVELFHPGSGANTSSKSSGNKAVTLRHREETNEQLIVGQPELCEWRPVIDRTKKRPKDTDASERKVSDEEANEFARAVRRADRELRKRSLDTDTTWDDEDEESATNDDDQRTTVGPDKTSGKSLCTIEKDTNEQADESPLRLLAPAEGESKQCDRTNQTASMKSPSFSQVSPNSSSSQQVVVGVNVGTEARSNKFNNATTPIRKDATDGSRQIDGYPNAGNQLHRFQSDSFQFNQNLPSPRQLLVDPNNNSSIRKIIEQPKESLNKSTKASVVVEEPKATTTTTTKITTFAESEKDNKLSRSELVSRGDSSGGQQAGNLARLPGGPMGDTETPVGGQLHEQLPISPPKEESKFMSFRVVGKEVEKKEAPNMRGPSIVDNQKHNLQQQGESHQSSKQQEKPALSSLQIVKESQKPKESQNSEITGDIENRISFYENVADNKPDIKAGNTKAKSSLLERQNSGWSVGSVEHLAERTKIVIASGRTEIPAGPEGATFVMAAPAKPPRRLVAMTSIVRDPEDELMGTGKLVSSAEMISKSDVGDSQGKQENPNDAGEEDDDDDGEDDEECPVESESSADSSLAAARESRLRLVSRFENAAKKPTIPEKPPRLPALVSGQRAAGTSSSSMVCRLAKTFEQQQELPAREQRISGVPRPSLAPKPSTGSICQNVVEKVSSRQPSVDEMSEAATNSSATDWFDANSGAAQLDANEVAEFLARFDGGTESASYVTIGDSFGRAEGGRWPRTTDSDSNDEDDDDDTLNDAAELSDQLDKVLDQNNAPKEQQLGEQRVAQQQNSNLTPSTTATNLGMTFGSASSGTTTTTTTTSATFTNSKPIITTETITMTDAQARQSDLQDQNKQLASDSLNKPPLSLSNIHPVVAANRSIVRRSVDNFASAFGEAASDISLASERDGDLISVSSSSLSYESIPEAKLRQNLQKLYHVVNEMVSTEAKFVDTLRLLNVDFREHMLTGNSGLSDEQAPGSSNSSSSSSSASCSPSSSLLPATSGTSSTDLAPSSTTTTTTTTNSSTGSGFKSHAACNELVQSLLKHMPQLQALNESLLSELEQASELWPKTQRIAHVLVKIGPFLKHYSSYIRDFESLQSQLQEALRKNPRFAERMRQFEASDRCQKLSVQHHLLKPIQRIPQYRLLLQHYLHYLKPDDPDYEDTVSALEVVSRVAEHANQSMKEGANFAKLLGLQARIVGKQRDIVQPGRLFLREGELAKVCRKQIQPRWFVLLSDALLYCTQIQSSGDLLYLNNELPLDDCQVSTVEEEKRVGELVGEQFATEFNVCTRARSFALVARSREERDSWVTSIRSAITELEARKRSFRLSSGSSSGQQPDALSLPPVASGATDGSLESTSGAHSDQCPVPLLGQKAPLWTADSRVSMCQLCTSSFTALFRRHHCRACGRVVCSACSSNKAPLIYLKCRSARVCDQCFESLKANMHLYYLASSAAASSSTSGSHEQQLRRLDEHFRTLLKSQFVKAPHASSKHDGGHAHKSRLSTGGPSVPTNDSGSTISGYLERRHERKAKWKRQWFVLKGHLLFAYRAIDDVAPASSLSLAGARVGQPEAPVDSIQASCLIRLEQTSPTSESTKTVYLFKAESVGAAERWLEAFQQCVRTNKGEGGT